MWGFVPIVVTPPPPSPRTVELSRRLREVIDAFRLEHPDLSHPEVSQALRLAGSRVRAGGSQIVVGLALGIALLLALGLFFAKSGPGSLPITLIALGIVGLLVVFIAVAAARNR